MGWPKARVFAGALCGVCTATLNGGSGSKCDLREPSRLGQLYPQLQTFSESAPKVAKVPGPKFADQEHC